MRDTGWRWRCGGLHDPGPGTQYGHLSGVVLSSLTHRAGTPRNQVYRDGVFNIEIPDDLIRAHYQQRYDEHQSRTAA